MNWVLLSKCIDVDNQDYYRIYDDVNNLTILKGDSQLFKIKIFEAGKFL